MYAFYWATSMLSALFDNAPTYLGFFAAALGLHALDINDSSHVARQNKLYSTALNVFLTHSAGDLINAAGKVPSQFQQVYERIIFVGMIVLLIVKGLYSRFCEKTKEER